MADTYPDEKRRLDELDRLIEAAASAGNRSRTVIIFLVFASVVAFSAAWSARDGSWVESRLDLARLALNEVTAPANTQPGAATETPVATTPGVATTPAVATTAISVSVGPEIPAAPLQDAGDDLRNRRREEARQWAKSRGFDTNPEGLKAFISSLEGARTEHLVIFRMPIFGVSFDMNDLGVISGVSFLILLGMLAFHLLRERRAIAVVFREARARGRLEYSYDLLSMSQVLSVPHSLRPGAPSYALLRLFVALPMGLPLIVHCLVFWFDLIWFPKVVRINSHLATSVLAFEVAMLALIGLITSICFWLAVTIDSTWDRAWAACRKDRRERRRTEQQPPPAVLTDTPPNTVPPVADPVPTPDVPTPTVFVFYPVPASPPPPPPPRRERRPGSS